MLSRVLETTKTVMIFVLCVTMLVMMLLLMIAEQDDGGAAYPLEERMLFYENGAEVTDGSSIDTSRVRPTAIAFRSPELLMQEGADTADATLRVVSDGDIVGRVYASLYPLLQDLLGHYAVGTELGDGDTRWEEALCEKELIYIAYPDDLPTAIIFAYTFADGEGEETLALPTSSVYGRELLFCEGENEDLVMLVRDSDGTVTCFSLNPSSSAPASEEDGTVPTGDTDGVLGELSALAVNETADTPAAAAQRPQGSLHVSTLSAYIETVGNLARDAYFACFLSELGDYDAKPSDGKTTQGILENDTQSGNSVFLDEEKEEGVFRLGGDATGVDTTLVYQSTRALKTAEVSPFAGMQVLDASGSEGLYTLLHMAAMRDSAIENHYTDRDGGRVYMDAHGRLYISADGEINYHALQNGGISGSTFLGYSNVSGVYTLRETLQIADRLVSAFSKEITPMLCGIEVRDGQAADSILKTPILSVTAEELEEGVSGVKVRYGYALDGLLLKNEAGESMISYTVVISGDVVYSFSAMPLYALQGEEAGYLLPVRVALQALTHENVLSHDRVGILEAAYVLHIRPDTKEVLMPEWLFIEK